MNFSEILKTATLQIINNLRFTEVFIGKVIDETNLKIKLDEKLILTEQQIIRTGNITGKIPLGTNILLLREQGGQRYFLINIIPDLDDKENVDLWYFLKKDDFLNKKLKL